MTTATMTEQNTLLSEMISKAMEEKGLSIRDLAVKMDITYEHVRRLVRGDSIPSKFVLKMLCDELGINFKEAERVVTADKIKKKFGSIPLELSGKKPAMEPLERVWDSLSLEQQRSIIDMAKAWARGNKHPRG